MSARSVIETAFRYIPDIYDGFNLVCNNIYREALEGEKRHRSGRQSPKSFPASLAAKYFTVKWLAGYVSGRDQIPTIADVHRMRKDCILAASYAEFYREQLTQWAKSIPAEFWDIDYAELMGAQS